MLLLSVLGLALLVAAGRRRERLVGGRRLPGRHRDLRTRRRACARVLTPLRDLFAAVFFLFFGLSTDPRDLVPMLVPAVALAVVTMGTKC